jgi:hypothetical protein
MRNESETRYLKKYINGYFRNKKENNKIEKSKDKYMYSYLIDEWGKKE